MNKLIRYFAAALLALLAPSAYAGYTLELQWRVPQTTQLSGVFDKTETPDWTTAEDSIRTIMEKSATRFATSFNDRVYTINMKTMSIAEITPDSMGVVDRYRLPAPEDKSEIYGTAISVDEAGNFLVGMNFTNTTSSNTFTVYSPTTGEAKRIVIPNVPNFRLDCVGRIIGDLTKEAYFYLNPGDVTDKKIRTIKATGNGTIESITMSVIQEVEATAGFYTDFAQPAYPTLADAKATRADAYKDFYYITSGTGDFKYINGVKSEINSKIETAVNSTLRGFATFHLGNMQYYVRNYTEDNLGSSAMGIAVYDSNGNEVAHWVDPTYEKDNGYSTIICRPGANNIFHIAVVNTGNDKGGAAALLNFVPEGILGTAGNPYKIGSVADLLALEKTVTFSNFYAELTDDIDFSTTIIYPVSQHGFIQTPYYVHLDGKGHIIKNMKMNQGYKENEKKWDSNHAYPALFNNFKGSIRNLGLEDVEFYSNRWGVAAPFVAYAFDATVENCYATGVIDGFYTGGIIGGVKAHGKAVVRNCYSLADLTSANGHGGGIVGPINNYASELIENCYFGGFINVSKKAYGLASGAYYRGETHTSSVINNCVAFTPSLVAEIVGIYAPETSEVNNCEVWDITTLHTSHVDAGKPLAELRALISSWDAFQNKLHNGYPALAWQVANREPDPRDHPCCADHPIKLRTAKDLQIWWRKIKEGNNYFTLEANIDMARVEYFAPITDGFTEDNCENTFIFIDGKNHVIKNLKPTGDYPSFIGIFQGEIKNLGLENIVIETPAVVEPETPETGDETEGEGDSEPAEPVIIHPANNIAGTFAAIIGHEYYEGTTKIENCYATGSVNGVEFAGGIAGKVCGPVSIKDTYANVDVTAQTAAGIIGSNNSTVTLDHVYASGTITAETFDAIINNADEETATIDEAKSYNALDADQTDAQLNDYIAAWDAFQAPLYGRTYPALAWQHLYNTPEDPYIVYTYDDLKSLGTSWFDTVFYVELANDLDLGDYYHTPIHAATHVIFDGKQHIIKNLTCKTTGSGNWGLFETFRGEIKNLGLENVDIENRWGVAGAFTGQSLGAKISNCYATGTVVAGSAGGFVGDTQQSGNIIEKSYSDVFAHSNVTCHAGGFVGRIYGETTISNSFAKGDVKSLTYAAGIASFDPAMQGTLTLNNVYAWNSNVDGLTVAPISTNVAPTEGSVCDYWRGMQLNGATTDEGISAHLIQGEMLHSEIFHGKLHNGYPVFGWESDMTDPNGEGLEFPDILIAYTATGEAQPLEDEGSFISNNKAVYVRFNKHAHFTVKHKYTLAAASPISTLALTADDGYEEYTAPIKITKPGTLDLYAHDDVNSPAQRASINLSGVTGVDDIIVDADAANAPATYYNLHGVEVHNPGTGVYLLRRGTKTEKVYIQ